MAPIIPVLAVLGSLASAATAVKNMTSGGGGGGGGYQSSQALKSAIARRTPDMLAQTGGGISPNFLSNLASGDVGGGQQASMDALKELSTQFPGLGGGGV